MRLDGVNAIDQAAGTAMMTPIGSMSTPSASRIVLGRVRSRISRSRGVTTVGPVTITRLPKSAACDHDQPRMARAAMPAPTKVARAP